MNLMTKPRPAMVAPLLVVAALVLVPGVGHNGHPHHHHSDHATAPVPPLPIQAELITGNFSLVNVRTGEQVTQNTFSGRHRLVFFGFTSCGTICPIGLAVLGQVIKILSEKRVDVVPIFITIDPRRDTPEKMKTYMDHFDPAIIGLSGTAGQVDQAMQAFRIEAHLIGNLSDDNYQFDHPGIFMLMGPDGGYVDSMPSSGDPDALAGRIEQVVGQD